MNDMAHDAQPASKRSPADAGAIVSAIEATALARQILDACGPGRTLHVGSGGGQLVAALCRAGIDASGVDSDSLLIATATKRLPGRFQQASPLHLPFAGARFETVVATGLLQDLPSDEVDSALRELARVTRRAVFIRVPAPPGGGRHPAAARGTWERKLLDAGLRKHPRCFQVSPCESLNDEPEQLILLMERTPDAPVSATPLDALRASGRGSDASLLRYHLAAQHVRPGDRVLDLACGAGSGAHLLRHASPAARVLGLEARREMIDYATSQFPDPTGVLNFKHADPLTGLAETENHSIELVIAFDLETALRDDPSLLKEIRRVLVPGGRLILSTPSRAQEDEFPSAFTADDVRALLSGDLLPESLYALNADRAEMRFVEWSSSSSPRGQSWIATAIRDPLEGSGDIPYQESVFANLRPAANISTDYMRWYRNPWIVHSLVHVGYRTRSPALLAELAERLRDDSPPDSADCGAALCILAYRKLEDRAPASDWAALQVEIEAYLKLAPTNPHVLRWQISLTFILARLHVQAGSLAEARGFFQACAAMDPFPFGVHLATKAADAAFWSGWLALAAGDTAAAGAAWTQGIDFGRRLTTRPLDEVLMNPADPNRFDHGDGMREFVLALESVTQCANGLHLLNRQRQGIAVNWSDVHKTFRDRGDRLAIDLRHAQSVATVLTTDLATARRQLIERTTELDASRQGLRQLTESLDLTRRELVGRTDDLDQTRQVLEDRSQALTAELDSARNDLLARNTELDAARQDLSDRTAEVDAARQDLIQRTTELDLARQDLIQRTKDLDATRQELIHRTVEVDAARKELTERTAELVDAKKRRWF